MNATRREHLVALNRQVVDLARTLKVLSALSWPEDAEGRFLQSVAAGCPTPPNVILTPPTGLVADAEFAAVAQRLDPGDPVQAWLGRTLESARAGMDLLGRLGKPGFAAASARLYGSPTDPCHPGAPSALAVARHFLRSTDRLRVSEPIATFDDEAALAWLRDQVEQAFPDDPPRVELDEGLPSLASASSMRIRLRRGARFSRVQLRQLLQHEALVHTATRRNGKNQPVLSALGLSLPRTTSTQEGLATLAELVTDTMDLARLRRIALRVVALHHALEGASFVDVWNKFRSSGQSDVESYQSAARIFRGGDGAPDSGVFAKDGVYVGGLMRVQGFMLTAIRDGEKGFPLHLFAGRLTSGDVVDLREAFEDGTIEGPRIAPEWVRDLDCLAASLTVAGLSTQIDLDAVELESFTER